MIKEEQGERQSVDSNQSVEFQYLTSKMYDQLLASHELAKAFISSLAERRDAPVNESLVNYCRQIKLGFKSAGFILDLMEARLNKMIKNNKLKKNWSTEDLQILVWLIARYLDKNQIQSHQSLTPADWQAIAAMIPGATPRSCMFKFVSLKKFKLAQHKWQKDEEALLLQIITQLGTDNWKQISEKLYEQTPRKRIFRTAKQCREHWSCYLDPRIKKGPWEREEDRKLLQIVLESSCQKKWSAIKLQFQGRTENALKNRYNLLLQKQKKLFPHMREEEMLVDMLREERESDGESKKSPSERGEGRTSISLPIPVIPEERRNMTVSYQPGIIIFFNGGAYHISS